VITRKQLKVEFARELRRKQTDAECIVWEALRNRKIGMKFRRQHPLKGFILDFYCPEKRLAIEIDGEIHKEQVAYDNKRQQVLDDQGIKVIRFSNAEAVYKIAKVICSIQKHLFDPPSP
jgi:cyclase